MEADANGERRRKQRIEAIRKSDFQFSFLKMANLFKQNIKIKLKKHAFLFGAR